MGFYRPGSVAALSGFYFPIFLFVVSFIPFNYSMLFKFSFIVF